MAAKFNFGKYRGRDIEEIRFKDPGYCRWCSENIPGFSRTLEDAVSASTQSPQRPPAREWHDNRHNPVLDAILADPTLAFTHPRERFMAAFEPDTFALGDAPPY